MDDRPIIVWFRRDLRLEDNPALLYAAAQDAPVLPVYATDWERDDRWAPGQTGSLWLRASLDRLSTSLAAAGAPLITVPGRAEDAIPALARKSGAAEVVWNRLYEPYSRRVDGRVAVALERDGTPWRDFNSGLLFEPQDVMSRSGKPHSQFTAFWRRCRSLPEPEPPFAAPARLRGPRAVAALGEPVPAGGQGSLVDWHSSPGEEAAQARLDSFIECCLGRYATARDFPGIEGTSRLSAHLHFGEIGSRQIWHAVREATMERHRGSGEAPSDLPGGDVGEVFLRQLGWREFAHHVLFHFPWTPEQPFRTEFADFPWSDDSVGLAAWKEGRTGYPLVDAAMRQLLSEGWVHNRGRMVAASFLTKDLLVPWQEGAAWYWDRLVDADLANNTLGWQWTAGSGPDAAPYFRVFNPDLQARRFDAEGGYVARWTPAGRRGQATTDGEAAARARRAAAHGEARARALAAFHGVITRKNV